MSWLDDLPKCPKSGKFRHPTEKSAAAQLAMLIRRGKPVGPRVRPYRCPSCGDWHIGHDARQLTRDIRRALAAGTTATSTAKRRRRR